MISPVAVSRTLLGSHTSSFVGRRHELDALRRAALAHRLVTLVGPGGVGKTRLALRAAAELTEGYADGAWSVPLATVHEAETLVDAVSIAIGLRDDSNEEPLERLVHHLHHRELLLVLDNCERLETAAAALVAVLLDRCPRLSVIVTSRHALGVPDELVMEVPPLAFPDGSQLDEAAQSVLDYDAVRLFLDRVRSSYGKFGLDHDNLSALVELMRRLGGIPLAIELAAVRVRSQSLTEILRRLDDRLPRPRRGGAELSTRAQTLAGLIEWSHDLLEPPERMLWRRLSVFHGSFDLDAVIAVACDSELPAQDIELHVDALVAQAILVAEGVGATPRFRQLEPLRDFGRRQLDDRGEADLFLQRHRQHYTRLSQVAAHELFGPDQVQWFRRLQDDHDNLRAALSSHLTSTTEVSDGLVLMTSLQHYWVMVGRFTEARRWLEALLERAPHAEVEHAAGLQVAGRLAVLQGDVEPARTRLEQSLLETTQLGDVTWRAHALHGLALCEVFWGRPAAAVPLLEEARDLHVSGEDPFGEPLALVQLATVHALLAHYDLAEQHAEQCLRLSARRSERWCRALALWTMALVDWKRGREVSARARAREVLRLKAPFGDRLGMAMCLEVIAWTVSRSGRHLDAAQLLGAADAALTSVGGALFGHLVDDHMRCVSRTREVLGDDRFTSAYERGARLEFERAVALALGGRRTSTAAADSSAVPPLSPRETEVALLVAQGLTSREIAHRLAIAARTAEGHVATALSKLGLTSRKQLGAWITDRTGASG